MCPRWLAALLSLSLTGILAYSFVSVVGLSDAALNAANSLPRYLGVALESIRPVPKPPPPKPLLRAKPKADPDQTGRAAGAHDARAVRGPAVPPPGGSRPRAVD